MYACRSVSVACRPAEKRRRRGEIGSIHGSILVGHRRPNRPQGVNIVRTDISLLLLYATHSDQPYLMGLHDCGNTKAICMIPYMLCFSFSLEPTYVY